MRVVICWTGISGYLSSCWQALAQLEGVDLKLICSGGGSANAPYNHDLVGDLHCQFLSLEEMNDVAAVSSAVSSHQPDIVVICGWHIPGYRHLPYLPELGKARFIMGMDTPWQGKLRQRLAPLKLRGFLRRVDRVVVAGERSWQYALRLGVGEDKIARGMYGINTDQLLPLHAQRLAQCGGWPRQFLYVGRYEPVKALDVLAKAYRIYRRNHADAWPLVACGAGPDARFLRGAGIENLGFVQPADQPPIWRAAGAFVIASRFDPWPLVIVEAAASGLPILCTESCGSSVEIVRPYYNGLAAATDSPESFADAMAWLHEHHGQLPQMGLRGTQLAAPYGNRVWALRWREMFLALLKNA